jgi:hypothetical protein
MQPNAARNRHFHPNREPLRHQLSLELQSALVSGPFSLLNPTQAPYRHCEIDEKFLAKEPDDSAGPVVAAKEDDGLHVSGPGRRAAAIDFLWRSRDNRKGRHALRIAHRGRRDAKYHVPDHTATLRATGRGIMCMLTWYPVWDVSYLVAVVFTLGSVVWVINAFFVWLPLVRPSGEFPGEILVGGGITGFVGATIFEIGSVLLMVEAVNENRSGCFGWALRAALHDASERVVAVEPARGDCRHHHRNRKNLVGEFHQSVGAPSRDRGEEVGSKRTWQWFPSRVDLQMHYLHELGFLACLAQFLGASVFWISGLTALPGIQDRLSQQLRNGIYWLPQIIGGTGFIISGTLFMLETQRKWYRPAISVLGWHIGFWNLVGAIGFTLCGALGPAYGNSGAEYQASLATFWGSWAFLIGSLIQWYESLDKYPVELM